MIDRLEIEGEPRPKGRPRFSCIKGKPHVYTDAKTLAAEQEIGWQLRAAMKGRTPTEERLFVRLEFYTKSKTVDADNLAKLVLDSANGIAFKDDRQIDSLYIDVFRGSTQPHTIIDISELGMAQEAAA
jgi:crossover junction endodeoxyribonuclease RusA